MRRKIWIFVSCSLLVGFYVIFDLAPRTIVQISGGIYSWYRPTARKDIPLPSDYGLQYSSLTFRTLDDLSLRGYIIHTDLARQKGTVIFLHGIRASKEHFLPLCKILADHGYNSVIVDSRAHGQSEGKYCTFGFNEKHDVGLIVDELLKVDSLSSNIGVWGQSLGGAIALQALAADERLRFGIVESTFADFRTVVHDYFRQHTGFDIPFLTDYFISRAESIAGFRADEVVPSLSSTNITQPVLMIHGAKDKRIAIAYGRKNYDQLRGRKEFIECAESDHLNVWQTCGKDYFNRVLDFMDSL